MAKDCKKLQGVNIFYHIRVSVARRYFFNVPVDSEVNNRLIIDGSDLWW